MTVKELEARVKELESKVRTQEDIESIKKLQRAYGYYCEHMMGQEIMDCFSKSPGVEIHFVEGTYLGQEGLHRYFDRRRADVPDELLHQVMQMSGIVDVDRDGRRAQGRWYAFGALAIPWADGVRQTWMSSIYEMDYVKEEGVWKILILRWKLTFNAPPEKGWVSRKRLPTKDLESFQPQTSPDIPATIRPWYPSGYIFPFHFPHPVTGQPTGEGERNAKLKNLKIE